jgi:hypothetical protein
MMLCKAGWHRRVRFVRQFRDQEMMLLGLTRDDAFYMGMLSEEEWLLGQ